MVVISEFPDGFDGGDPNKKPQEPQKNPKEEKEEEEEEENRMVPTTNLPELCFAPSFESLPAIVTDHCLARVPIIDYTALSLTSKFFRGVVKSPRRLGSARFLFGTTERVLYAMIGFPPAYFPSWFVLHRRGESSALRLRRVTALPLMPFGSAVVTVGPMIYVFGGRDVGRRYKPDVLAIDCIDHTWRWLPKMKIGRYCAAAGVIDGIIYVVGGGHTLSTEYSIETFDLGRGEWVRRTNSLRPPFDVGEFVTYAVMQDKIYALSRECCYVYEPRGEIWHILQSADGRQLRSLWQASSCVVDGLLYTIDPSTSLGQPLVVYDPEKMEWEPVILGTITRALLTDPYLWYESKMVNLDGKLVVLVGDRSRWSNCYGEKNIIRLQIALERLEGGQIRGNVELMDLALTASISPPAIEFCVAVTV